jgi:hypothetical protein
VPVVSIAQLVVWLDEHDRLAAEADGGPTGATGTSPEPTTTEPTSTTTRGDTA